MKQRLSLNGRRLVLLAVLLPLLGLFVFVMLRAGPLAPVPVVAVTVEERALTPALFGIGTVAARYTYRIGPTVAGRVQQVNVEVGERVHAGQVLGEMDPVDLDERLAAQQAAQLRARANVAAAQAQVADVSARRTYAAAQAERYEQLLRANTVSADAAEAKRQELQVAEAGLTAARANLEAARQELGRVQAEQAALVQQRDNLRLLAPVDGLVTARAADPGTTVLAGQPVVEVVDPASLWVHVRFDQLRAAGLRAGLPAQVVLRSQAMQPLAGKVLRIEPLADAQTEEFLAKVVFDTLPETLPPIGELAEVTVAQPALPPAPVVPTASVQHVDGRLGVWRIVNDALEFAAVELGASDLDGRVQIRSGLQAGERVVAYSQRALAARHRITLVDRLPGVAP
jgi:RND family efflux transporter MFP subunit